MFIHIFFRFVRNNKLFVHLSRVKANGREELINSISAEISFSMKSAMSRITTRAVKCYVGETQTTMTMIIIGDCKMRERENETTATPIGLWWDFNEGFGRVGFIQHTSFSLIRLRRSKTWSTSAWFGLVQLLMMRMHWVQLWASVYVCCLFVGLYLCGVFKFSDSAMQRDLYFRWNASQSMLRSTCRSIHKKKERWREKKTHGFHSNRSRILFVCQSFPMTTIKKIHCMKTSKLWLYKSYIIY